MNFGSIVVTLIYRMTTFAPNCRACILAIIGLSFGSIFAACAGPRRLSYSPRDLSLEVAGRSGKIRPEEVIIPFEVPENAVQAAARIVFPHRSEMERAQALKNALFDPAEFGLRYSNAATLTAAEALDRGEGNCFSLASVFIGLARSVGLRVYYLDASNRAKAMYRAENAFVRVGHVTAVIETAQGRFPLDFGRQLLLHRSYKVKIMDDLEALAHYYNNRGYDLIREGQSSGGGVDWSAVEESFFIATRIKPNFARAWNNLGVANARLGDSQSAENNYLTAIKKAPKFVSPHVNLGLLHLQAGDFPQAVKYLEAAHRLDPKRPHIQLQLGLALLGQGRKTEAVQALKRAVELKDDYARAQTVLGQALSEKQP